MNEQKKRGRPKIDKSKNAFIGFTCTQEEKDAIQIKASESGLSLSAFILFKLKQFI